MVRTEVGYAGGDKLNPTYHDLGSHAEVLQVEFDPDQLGFEQLLELFWAGHAPTRANRGSQYRSILLCENDSQLAVARASIGELEDRLGAPVRTEVVVGKPFYPAEDYHQKWKLRQRRQLFASLAKKFDSENELLRSFAATKLNAIAGGYLTRSEADALLGQLGLSTNEVQLLG